MERFLFGTKSRNQDEEASKSRHKKTSKKKSTSDNKRSQPSVQSFFPPQESVFKKLDTNKAVASSPCLRRLSKSQPNKKKDTDIKKILGIICGDDTSKKRKKHSGRKSNDNSSSSESSLNFTSQVNERRSHRKSKKLRDDFQQNFDENERQRKVDHFYQSNEIEDLRRSDEDHRLRKPPSSSESEKDSPSLLGAESPFQGNLFRNRRLDLEKSPEIVRVVEKEETVASPVSATKKKKDRHDDQELIAEFMDFASDITKELTVERLKICGGKSYLETVSQNLLRVYHERNNCKKQTEKEGSSKHDTLEDFITPAAAREIDQTRFPIQNDKRRNQGQRIESPRIYRPLENVLGKSQNSTSQGDQSSAWKRSFPDQIFSQPKPKSQPGKVPRQWFDFGTAVEEREPNFLFSPEIPPDPLGNLDSVSCLKKIGGPKPNNVLDSKNDAPKLPSNSTSSQFLKELSPRSSPERQYQFSPSPLLHISQNDYDIFSLKDKFVEPREKILHHQEKQIIPSRVSCTATSTKPMDSCIKDVFVLPEIRFHPGRKTFFEPTSDFQDPDRRSRLRGLQSTGDFPSDAHSFSLSQFEKPTSSQFYPKESPFHSSAPSKATEDDWIASPRYYRRRMF